MGKADEILKSMRERRSKGSLEGRYRNSQDTSPLSSRESLDGLQSQIGEMRPIRRKMMKWESSISKFQDRKSMDEQSTISTDVTASHERYLHSSSSSSVSPERSSLWMSEMGTTTTAQDRPFMEPLSSKASSSSSCIAVGELDVLDRKLARMRETFAKLESETADLNHETDALKEQVSQGLWKGKRGILGVPSKRKPLVQQEPELTLALSSSSEEEDEDESLPSMRSDVLPHYNMSSYPSHSTSSLASVEPGRPPVPSRSPSPLQQHVASFLGKSRR